MKNGDLSNLGPRRWMVVHEALLEGIPSRKKFLEGQHAYWARDTRTRLSRTVVGGLWLLADKYGLSFECAGVFLSEGDCELLQEWLDGLANHPIIRVDPYPSREELRALLPFRPDVQTVIDTDEWALYWGGRGRRVGEVLRFG